MVNARNVAERVLRNPGSSKKAKTARGSALSQSDIRWSIRRKKPYTQIGVSRLKCVRCGEPAHTQWQICSDGNNYRPACVECDIELNRLVLGFFKHPFLFRLMQKYRKTFE